MEIVLINEDESSHWQFTDDGAASNIRFMLPCGLPIIFSAHCSNVCLHHVMLLNRLKQTRNRPFSHSTLIFLVEHLEKAKKSASKMTFIMVMKAWKKPVSGWSRVLGTFNCSKPQWQQMGLNVPGARCMPGTQQNHSVIHNQYWDNTNLIKTQMTLVV